MLRFAPEPHNFVGGSCLIAVFSEDYVIHTRIGEVQVLECLCRVPTFVSHLSY